MVHQAKLHIMYLGLVLLREYTHTHTSGQLAWAVSPTTPKFRFFTEVTAQTCHWVPEFPEVRLGDDGGWELWEWRVGILKQRPSQSSHERSSRVLYCKTPHQLQLEWGV